MAGRGGVRVPRNPGPKYEQNGLDYSQLLDHIQEPTAHEIHRAELQAVLRCEKPGGGVDIPAGRLLLAMLGREGVL